MTIRFDTVIPAPVTASLPLVESVRTRLEAGISRRLAAIGPQAGPAPETVARELMQILIQAAHGRPEPHVPDHLALGGEHYSAFGDALKPILQDALGASATPALIAAWGDVYWAAVSPARISGGAAAEKQACPA
jgi:hypothetical protein